MGWEARIVDREKNIIYLKWIGFVKKEEVQEANQKLEQIFQELNADSFDFIVEMEDIMAFSKETQQEIVEQQKWVLSKGLRRSAVVVEKVTTKMQLKRTAESSNNDKEIFFDSFEEALEYLRNN